MFTYCFASILLPSGRSGGGCFSLAKELKTRAYVAGCQDRGRLRVLLRLHTELPAKGNRVQQGRPSVARNGRKEPQRTLQERARIAMGHKRSQPPGLTCGWLLCFLLFAFVLVCRWLAAAFLLHVDKQQADGCPDKLPYAHDEGYEYTCVGRQCKSGR